MLVVAILCGGALCGCGSDFGVVLAWFWDVILEVIEW